MPPEVSKFLEILQSLDCHLLLLAACLNTYIKILKRKNTVSGLGVGVNPETHPSHPPLHSQVREAFQLNSLYALASRVSKAFC